MRDTTTVTPTPARSPGWPLSHDDLVADGLVHHYGSTAGQGPALAGVSLRIAAGESVAVMGPSGSGKTTLLHVLAGIIRPTSGSVGWRGRDITGLRDRERTALRRNDFGFVFQSGQLLPELPAEENAALPLMLGGISRAAALAHVRPILDGLGLQGLGARRPGELSGGQAQRVAIARALAGSPGVVFADEPTGALDQQTGGAVMAQLVAATRAHGASLVVVTHDPGVARACERTLVMRDGLVVAEHLRDEAGR
ncbi:MAG: ABC transporter ATP-binding protein [Micrococcales bacterium]|nr:ABC transporter ATP-binding protein [Micrococcales bacterium]